MTNYFKQLFQGWFAAPSTTSDSEVERIAILQKAASKRRAEYAEKKARSASDATLTNALLSSRKLMEEAESAHLAALQKWENKQFRQRSY